MLPVGDQETSRWQDDLKLVASATGRDQRATELLRAYDDRVAALKNSYAGVLAERTFAPMNYDLENDSTDSRAKRLLSTVMTDLGMRPSTAFAAAIEGKEPEFGPEQLLTGYGDASGLVAVVTEPEAWRQLQQRPLYQQLTAAREGHIVRADRRTHEGAALTDLHHRDRVTVIMVLHDLSLAARYADHLIAMRDGRVVDTGAVAEVLTPDLVRRVFDVEARILADPDTGRPLIVPRDRNRTLRAG